ncbi:hypothetical protein [Anaplasma phagocytophilum]|uniref:hypothetical protein n=1 Tax=Anaplasma phagocytophilum TaxID=948 RepID=UPI00201A35DE
MYLCVVELWYRFRVLGVRSGFSLGGLFFPYGDVALVSFVDGIGSVAPSVEDVDLQ